MAVAQRSRKDLARHHLVQVTPMLDTPLWLKPAQRKVKDLSDLPFDWDTYGSPPIPSGVTIQAYQLLNDLSILNAPRPQISAVSGGGLQFDLQDGPRELELEILPTGTVLYFFSDADRTIEEEIEPTAQPGFLSTLVDWLLKLE